MAERKIESKRCADRGVVRKNLHPGSQSCIASNSSRFCPRNSVPVTGLARLVAGSIRLAHDLRAPRPSNWPVASRSRSRERGRRQPDCVYHSVPPRHSRNGRTRQLSLGPDSQTRHRRMGALVTKLDRRGRNRSNQGHRGLTTNLRSTSSPPRNLVCRLLLEKKKNNNPRTQARNKYDTNTSQRKDSASPEPINSTC